MTFDQVAMIQQKAIARLETLLEEVVGSKAAESTAYEMEQYLFQQVLAIGAELMEVYLAMHSAMQQRQAWYSEEGERLPYHGERRRQYRTIFGQLEFERPYFYAREHGGASPLDAALGLDKESCYSDVVRELHEELASYLPYRGSCKLLKRLLGLELSTRVMQQFVEEDGADVEAYYAQKEAPVPEEEGEYLVLQADGKGIPLVRSSASHEKVRLRRGEARSRKKQVVVTSLYTIPAAPRTAEAVLGSLLNVGEDSDESRPERHRPRHKQLWGTLAGKAAALGHLAEQVAKRDGDHIQARLMLCDGDKSLQSNLRQRFPQFTLILDFIHVYEYLWQAANVTFGEQHPQRVPWVYAQTRHLLTNQANLVIDELHRLAAQTGRKKAQRDRLRRTAHYLANNAPYMAYATYLAKGWPIASGVIEGACRHFVKDRLELSGMRWRVTGAENLLRLRAVAENDDWDDYHRFRRQQRQQRQYGRNWPPAAPLPTIASGLRRGRNALRAIPRKRKTTSAELMPSYTELPLAR
jgi:hypothetical protein